MEGECLMMIGGIVVMCCMGVECGVVGVCGGIGGLYDGLYGGLLLNVGVLLLLGSGGLLWLIVLLEGGDGVEVVVFIFFGFLLIGSGDEGVVGWGEVGFGVVGIGVIVYFVMVGVDVLWICECGEFVDVGFDVGVGLVGVVELFDVGCCGVFFVGMGVGRYFICILSFCLIVECRWLDGLDFGVVFLNFVILCWFVKFRVRILVLVLYVSGCIVVVSS